MQPWLLSLEEAVMLLRLGQTRFSPPASVATAARVSTLRRWSESEKTWRTWLLTWICTTSSTVWTSWWRQRRTSGSNLMIWSSLESILKVLNVVARSVSITARSKALTNLTGKQMQSPRNGLWKVWMNSIESRVIPSCKKRFCHASSSSGICSHSTSFSPNAMATSLFSCSIATHAFSSFGWSTSRSSTWSSHPGIRSGPLSCALFGFPAARVFTVSYSFTGLSFHPEQLNRSLCDHLRKWRSNCSTKTIQLYY